MQNIIVDTTVKFIRADEKYLSLALEVEKALPAVREALIKETLECVESDLNRRLSGTGDASEKWHVKVIEPNEKSLFLRVCKEHWLQQKMKEYKPRSYWGVLLSVPVTRGRAWISVADISEMSDTSKEKIRASVESCVGGSRKDQGERFSYLQNDLSDWTGAAFMKKAIKEKKRKKVAYGLAGKLEELAREVDKILGEEQPQTAS